MVREATRTSIVPSAPPRLTHYRIHWTRQTRAPASLRSLRSVGGPLDVGVAAGVDPSALAGAYGTTALVTDRPLRAVEVAGTPAALGRLAAAVGRDHRIRYVAPVLRAQLDHARSDPLTITVDPQTQLPYEWPFTHVQVDKALNITHGDPKILVGVVDTGFGNVRDLPASKIAKSHYFPFEASDPLDTEGHGTFVSSIIAAPNDDGFGLAGFCGACRVDMVKAVSLFDFEVADGIRMLTDDHVRVINLSLGFSEFVPVVADALQYAIQNGVLVVASSGNDGKDTVHFPASFLQPADGVPGAGLAVGASDRADNRADFSDGGANLSLVAPGTMNGTDPCSFGVWGALPTVATEFDGSCDSEYVQAGTHYAYASGTSFSAPEVAGIAALLWAAKPDLKSTDVARLITQSATRPAGTGWRPDLGWGVVNAARALELATGRSSADSVKVSRLHAGLARQGRVFLLRVTVAWGDAAPVSSGTVSCTARIGGRTLVSPKAALNGGAATCRLRLPSRTAGKRLVGIAVGADADGNKASRSFAVTVRR